MLIKLLILSSSPPHFKRNEYFNTIFANSIVFIYEKSYTSLPIQVITATINLKLYTIS